MKKFKNRKNVKNVNNTVKNNANMDGFEELVKAAKEFKGALDDEVANREYERKKLAEAFEKKASNDAKKGAKAVVENPALTIDDVINAETISDLKIFTFGPRILSSEPRGRVRTYDDWYGDKSAVSAMQAVKDAINAKIVETKGARKSHEEAFWHKVKKDITKPVTDEKCEKSKFYLKPYCLEREDFLTYKVEKSKKNKPASEVESLKSELENLNAHFEGVCAERDNLAACLKSCEKDLKQKQDEAVIMRQEAVFQFKRAEKAEALIKQIDDVCDLIKEHIAAYGSKKKSK